MKRRTIFISLICIFSVKEKLVLQIGDIIEIIYNGDILESYPAQLGEVYKITLLEQAKTAEFR